MATSVPKALLFAAFAWPASHAHAAHFEQQGVVIDADSLELDYKNNNLILHKVRIAQGAITISAEQSQAKGLDFENNQWVFRGNVRITMEQGSLTSDVADVTFVNKALTRALVTGRPAAFEQRIAKTGKLAQGHADSIEYQVGKGVVHFSSNAWLSDGQNEIRGESLKYSMLTHDLSADSSEQGSQRVHIILTPKPVPKP